MLNKNIFKIDWQGFLDRLRTFSPRKSGALGEHWRIVSQTETQAVFQNDLPYARIQDLGGHIPPVSGKLMVFNIGGETIFTRQRKGFMLKGFNYSQRAFDSWFISLGRDK